MINFKFVSYPRHNDDVSECQKCEDTTSELTMGCELESCGFWLYFFFRMDLTERKSSRYVCSGFCPVWASVIGRQAS